MLVEMCAKTCSESRYTCFADSRESKVYNSHIVKGPDSVVTYHDIVACQVEVCHLCTPMHCLHGLQPTARVLGPTVTESHGHVCSGFKRLHTSVLPVQRTTCNHNTYIKQLRSNR